MLLAILVDWQAGKLTAAARALYAREMTDAELAEFGLARKDYARDDVELWPEHWTAFRIFAGISTQWRQGPSGPTGLDYMVVYKELERAGLQGEAHHETFAMLQVMERAALEEIYSGRDK